MTHAAKYFMLGICLLGLPVSGQNSVESHGNRKTQSGRISFSRCDRLASTVVLKCAD